MTARRRLHRSVAAGCCVVSCLALAACTSGASSNTTQRARSGSVMLRVLQMNLCNSGIASCYTGRSVAEAAAVVRAERPDIVTLNEVCRDDVSVLQRALSGVEPGSIVTPAFRATPDQRTGKPFRCRNGEQFGIAVLARVRSPDRGHTIFGGRYAAQDPADTEQRVWACVRETGHFLACTTHLSSTSRAVAVGQCRYLMDVAIPALRRRSPTEPVILGADLNLSSGGTPNAQSCAPPGYVRTDDGSRQYIMASAPFTVSSRRTIDMRGTTDHPGLLADLAEDRPAPGSP